MPQQPLRIALVGPGIMSIPPVGWGALEQLIWECAIALRKEGHFVEIINTPERDEIVAHVAAGKFDVVHVHYDVFWDILDKLFIHTRLLCMTSQYPYIRNEAWWKAHGYITVFAGICSAVKRGIAKLFVVSHADAEVYMKKGDVSAKDIVYMPNGIDVAGIRMTTTPVMADRSIVLAKIERRKRQCLTETLRCVDYIGDYSINRGPCVHSNYRGEISPSVRAQVLTEWGNLILLSEGENDPLVVKEAMASGLGCVLSEQATTAPMRTLSWVTIIPETDITNPTKVLDAIEKNRAAVRSQRQEIRDWAMSHWDWSVTIQQYCSKLYELLDG